jgi:4-hydroxybenzoate polyprenyltransferase
MKSLLGEVKNYASLVKLSHTIFALPFALIGFFIGVFYEQRSFEWSKLIFVILCMVTARNAAMAFNRWLDARFDKLNPRTAVREIPAGIISDKNALAFVIINCVLFIISAGMLQKICLYLSPVALFVILFYSYTKRFTSLCHLVLGVGLALAPVGAYLAITNYFHWMPIVLGIAVLCWVAGFDIIYALQDEDFDKSQSLNSIPVLVGKNKALMISNVLHILSAICIITFGYFTQLNFWYWIGATFFCGLLIYQHQLVKPNDLSKVNLAFFTTNGIASVVFAFFVLIALYQY